MSKNISKTLDRIQSIWHGWIYIILFVLVIIPLVNPIGLGIGIGRLEKLAFDYVKTIPAGSKVLYYTNMASWTVGNTAPTIALVEELYRQNLKIIFVPHGSEAPNMIQRVLAVVPSATGKVYGTDWLILSILPDLETNQAQFANDIPGTSPSDSLQKKPVSTFPIMTGIKTARDVALGVNQEEEGSQYIRQVAGPYGLKTISIHGVDKIPTHAAWLESGLIVGAIDGVPAAAAYEVMLGMPREASKQMDVMSFTVLYALILLAIGNAAVIMRRYANPKLSTITTVDTKKGGE